MSFMMAGTGSSVLQAKPDSKLSSAEVLPGISNPLFRSKSQRTSKHIGRGTALVTLREGGQGKRRAR